MANGLAFSAGVTRVARDGLDGAVIEGRPPVVFPVDDDDVADRAGDSPDRTTIDVSGTTYAVGSEARELAADRDGEPQPIFVDGILCEEPYAKPALEGLVAELLANGMGSRLCYTMPGTPVDADVPTDRHRDAVDEAVRSLGYDATPVSTGYAVVADQLADDTFTGLGIDIGPEVTSVALVYYGVPVIAFSLAKGRSWIVEQAADASGHESAEIAGHVENFTLDPDAAGDVESALARAYDELCGSLVTAIRTETAAAELERGIAVPVAVAGSAAVEGVEYLFGGRFDAADLPFSIRGVRRATSPEESAVRGALVAAQEDVEDYEDVTWSTRPSPAPGSELGAERLTDIVDGVDDPTDIGLNAAGGDDIADDAVERLFDRLGTRDEELDDLRSDVESVRSDVDTLRSDLEGVETTAALADDLDETDARLDEIETTLGDVEDTLSTVADADRVASLEADLERFDDALETVNERLDAELADRDDALQTIESTVNSLKSELEDTTEAIVARIDEVEPIQAAVDSIEPDVDALEATVEALESDVSSIESDVDELAAIDSSVEANATAIEDIKETVSTLESTVSTLEATGPAEQSTVNESVVSEIRTDLNDEIDDRYEVTETLEARCDSLEADVSSLGENLETVSDDITEIRQVYDDGLDEHGETLEEVGSTADKIESVEATLDELATALESLESDVTQLPDAASISSMEATLESTVEGQSELDARVTELESLQERIDELGPLAERVESGESESISGRPLERIAELDQRVHVLSETVSERADEVHETESASPAATAVGAGLAPILAGGASAGVVSGATVVAVGAVELGIGLVVAGVLTLGGVLLTR